MMLRLVRCVFITIKAAFVGAYTYIYKLIFSNLHGSHIFNGIPRICPIRKQQV